MSFCRAQRRLGDQRMSIGPVIAAARQQSHALALTLDNQAVAVVFNFVKPVRTGRDFGAARRNARLILKLTQHGA